MRIFALLAGLAVVLCAQEASGSLGSNCSDSPNNSVVCLGADPTGVLDSYPAFTAALSASNNVQIPCGKFKLSATIRMATSGQRLIGSGDCTILVAHDDDTSVLRLGGSASDIRVSSLLISGRSTPLSEHHSHYAALIVTDYANPPLHTEIDHVHFSGPNVRTGWVRALDITGMTYGNIHHNQLDHGFGNQYAVGILMGDAAAYNLVVDNVLSFPGQVKAAIAVRVLKVGGCCNVISRNKVNGGVGVGSSGGAGIIVHASEPTPTTANIDSTQILDNEIWGVTGASQEGLEAGIQIGGQTTNTLVAHNNVHDNSQHGIVLEDDATTGACIRVMVVGNEIYRNNGNGIFQRGCTDNLIVSNYIHDNDQEMNFWLAATTSSPVTFTTSTYNRLSTGTNIVYVHGGTGAWAALNGVQTATFVSYTTASIAVDTSTWPPFATSGPSGGPQQMYASMSDGIQLNTNGTAGSTRTVLCANRVMGSTHRYAVNIVSSSPVSTGTVYGVNDIANGSVAGLFDGGTATFRSSIGCSPRSPRSSRSARTGLPSH